MNSHADNSKSTRLEDFGLTADRHLVRHIAIAMLAFGGAIEVMYSVAFHKPDWTDAAAIGLVALATAWVLIVRWERSSPRMIVGPVLLGVAAVAMVGIGDNVMVGLSFLFLPAAVVMVFYWNDVAVQLAIMVPLTVTYVAVPAIWGSDEALIEALTTLPLLLGCSMILGAMFNRFRTASVEQARFRGTITALLMALDARDDYTAEHSSEVLSLVMAVSEDLGLEGKETLHTADVALLHDIGKIGIPNEILDKPSALSEEEWTVMRRHPEIGERILNEVPGFENVANAVRHEHERWDGTGYPDGLKAEEIPVASRVVLACDAYHAMTSERPYREPLSEAQAREQLRQGSGTQFDPTVVGALLAALEARDGVPVIPSPSWRESLEEGVVSNLRALHGEVSGRKTA
ncbi:MAG: HD-GYP domain-containing protein [Thermoleophilaceae bacterium]|nr:HD-GYP domain-containing protein [Thermoleophilaceae bacterium]